MDVIKIIKGGDLEKLQDAVEKRGKGILSQASKKGEIPLHIAVQEELQDIVEYLIEAGQVDINAKDKKDGRTALGLACVLGAEQVADYLLRRGDCDVNSQDKEGYTPLLRAIEGNQASLAQTLMEHNKVNIHLKNNSGDGALHFALANEDAQTALLLLKKGAKVNEPDSKGRRPVFWPSIAGNQDLVKLLIEKSSEPVDLNAQDKDGDTPLHVAYAQGHVKLAKYLEEKGANPGIKNNQGLTPRDKLREAQEEEKQEQFSASSSASAHQQQQQPVSDELSQLLASHGLSKYLSQFRQRKITVDNVSDLEEEDLKKMGISTNERRSFVEELNKRKKRELKSKLSNKPASSATTNNTLVWAAVAFLIVLLALMWYQSLSKPSKQ